MLFSRQMTQYFGNNDKVFEHQSKHTPKLALKVAVYSVFFMGKKNKDRTEMCVCQRIQQTRRRLTRSFTLKKFDIILAISLNAFLLSSSPRTQQHSTLHLQSKDTHQLHVRQNVML